MDGQALLQPVMCPLCTKRISEWMMAAGKCVFVKGRMVHKVCVMERDLSISELEKEVENASVQRTD